MKHSLSITLFLLGIFLAAQFIGLGIVYRYIDVEKTAAVGKTTFQDLPVLGERPPVNETFSFIQVLAMVLIGTLLLLAFIKFKLHRIWKIWFLIAVVITLLIAFSAFIPLVVAIVLALGLGIWKVFRPNVWVHNFTELFVYGGLAAIFVSWFNLISASVLLVLISLYDAYAVWKSKHMITLAKSQAKAQIFAGLLIPYQKKGLVIGKVRRGKEKLKKAMGRTAILGGGDIGFPLIFASVVLKEWGLWQSLLIPFFSCLGLGLLLWFSKEKKFYPAMPFISAGCFVGLGVVWLVGML